MPLTWSELLKYSKINLAFGKEIFPRLARNCGVSIDKYFSYKVELFCRILVEG